MRCSRVSNMRVSDRARTNVQSQRRVNFQSPRLSADLTHPDARLAAQKLIKPMQFQTLRCTCRIIFVQNGSLGHISLIALEPEIR